MPNVLAFTDPSHKLVTPALPEGFGPGVTVQLWVRRTGAAVNAPILAFADGTTRVVLGTGDSPDELTLALITGGNSKKIAAVGALPQDRWVPVEMQLGPNGGCVLSVFGLVVAKGEIGVVGKSARTATIGGGFVGELAQLQVRLGQTNPVLWASYPLDAVVASGGGFVAADVGGAQRHATGKVALTSVTHEEEFADGPAAVYRLKGDEGPTYLSPITGLSGQVMIEAWVRPAADTQAHGVMTLADAMTSLVLSAGGKDGEVTLRLVIGGQSVVLCRATGVVEAGAWSQVGASIAFKKDRSFTANVNEGGRVRASREIAVHELGSVGISALTALLDGGVVPTCTLGAESPSVRRLCGALAEARVWRTADTRRMNQMWLVRARGDEQGLVACYRLDAMSQRSLVDVSTRRGFARAPVGASIIKVNGLPIASTLKARAVVVEGRGKLVRERLPVNAKNLDPNLKIGKLPVGKGTERSVFDATLEARAAGRGSLAGRKFEIRVDRPLIFLKRSGGEVVPTRWLAGDVKQIAIPASGRLRLRFLAEDLACPTIRVRVSGSTGDVWTIVRPDEATHLRLRGVTGKELRTPSDGRPSPLSAGTDEDAAVLADSFRTLGKVFDRGVVTPEAKSPSIQAAQRFSIGDAIDVVVDTGGDLVDQGTDVVAGIGSQVGGVISGAVDSALDGATRASKTASALIRRGVDEVDALRKKAANAAVRVGEQAIAKCIDSADQLAVVAAQAQAGVVRVVEIVGTSIVDGAEVAWRAIVSSVDEALAAMEALAKRIAAEIQKILDFLAFLFAWDDFLAKSDDLLEIIESNIVKAHQQIAGLSKYKATIADTLRAGIEQAIGERSLGDLCGIDPERTAKIADELDYWLELFDDAMTSAELAVSGEDDAVQGVSIKAAAGLDSGAQLAASAIPAEKLKSLPAMLGTPVSELLASNGSLADGSSSVLDTVFDTVVGGGADAIKSTAILMKARIDVPWLTDMIESVILGGRTFNLLRVIALAAAIPAVLTEKLSSGQTATSTRSTVTPETRSGSKTRAKDDIAWVCMAFGLINTVVIIAQTVREYGESASSAKQGGEKFLTMTSGFCCAIRGFLTSVRADKLPEDTRPYVTTNAIVDLCIGVWVMLGPVGETKYSSTWAGVDLGAQVFFGVVLTTVAAIGFAKGNLSTDRDITGFTLRSGSWVGNALVRISARADDRDTTGKVKGFTIGLSVVVFGIDVAEAVYSNVGEVETQTE